MNQVSQLKTDQLAGVSCVWPRRGIALKDLEGELCSSNSGIRFDSPWTTPTEPSID